LTEPKQRTYNVTITSLVIVTMLKPKSFSNSLFNLKGISKKTIEAHLKLYQSYVNKYNEINEKLSQLRDDEYSKANQVFSTIRELKTELSFAWGGVVNHEIYFSHLGGTTSSHSPSGKLLDMIKKDFGSFDNYKKDLKATGLASRGWTWTVWNPKEQKLYNHLGDSQNTYAFWYAKPILALDVYEHAYFMNYGVDRASYIDVFLENLNWTVIGKNFKNVPCC